ncbi:hypothetical protein [Cellulomonas cellasea]|uniref:Lipoprotein n=1 Tax=Cellulomonas cellasea TaxID=43670 RepID=A0A7W4UHU8_9CELL|nr:hypothetical protein [Cellulomonas cellasea]MBB2924124.1 hypothetical protein [Cellulomonas cellasea]
MTRRVPGRPATAVLVPLLAVAALAACTGSDPSPAPTSAASAGPSSSSGPTAEPTPSAADPTTAPLALHPEGRIDDFPPNAPEADVVAHLTERLGAAPETLDAQYACEPAGQPGRFLAWPGLRLYVLTSDPEGGETDPYVGGWSLHDEDGGDPALATVEGLRIGDPQDRITELYPEAVSSTSEPEDAWWWDTRGDGGYTVVAPDEGSGPAVGVIASGYFCTAS